LITIRIIGSGNIGEAIDTPLTRKGIWEVLSNSCVPESLHGITGSIGTSIIAGSVADAVSQKIVFVDMNVINFSSTWWGS
jgi:predicted dinucleotide-binding enzyme